MKKAKNIPDGPRGKEHPAIECLRMICDIHFKEMMSGPEKNKDSTEARAPATGKFKPTPSSTVRRR
ncbi:MAG: hypothetical protein E5X04_00445 [Mesorhizobium sp.]|nr:MAG: hypothetical protein E5X04_00445 [Mesorhizobium sp.]